MLQVVALAAFRLSRSRPAGQDCPPHTKTAPRAAAPADGDHVGLDPSQARLKKMPELDAGRPFRNKLLSLVQGQHRDALRGELTLVEIKAGEVLERANQPITHVYFPESGIASLIVTDGRTRRMEAGPFGRDGMSGVAVILDAGQTPHETLVQVPGSAYRMPAENLTRILDADPAMRRLFLRYAQAFAIQTAQTALAAAHAVLEVRLARWILMLHDRVDGDEFSLTHDFMSLMLAVRRPGVTVALHELEGRGLIRSKRGWLLVRNRKGLELACRGLYGVPEAEYARLIG